MANVPESAIAQVLRPHLGSPVTDGTPLCLNLAAVFRSYAPFKESYAQLAGRLESVLFNGLYDALGERMTVRRDDGTAVRIRMKDLPNLADETMGAMFDTMEVYSVNYGNLKEYAMEGGSLSALRVLYQRYDGFLKAGEKEQMVRYLTERFPEERYRSWLKDAPPQE